MILDMNEALCILTAKTGRVFTPNWIKFREWAESNERVGPLMTHDYAFDPIRELINETISEDEYKRAVLLISNYALLGWNRRKGE